MAAMPMFMVRKLKGEMKIVPARNVNLIIQHQRSRWRFIQGHSFWSTIYVSQQSLGCLNLNFSYGVQYYSVEQKQYKYDIYFRSRDGNGHLAHLCETKYA